MSVALPIPRPADRARLAPGARPVLLVVVDTEEEFDWSQPFDRRNVGVTHMRSIERFQRVCDEFGVRPVYVIDHPIATQPTAYEPLRAFHGEKRCEIGAHLHPWVCPPYDEVVNAHNSYPGNLERSLERAKLATLTQAIEAHVRVRPRVYKAGRYGFGPNTSAILRELGYRVDLSPCPAFDLSADGGPDWSEHPAWPSWTNVDGEERALLTLPTSGAFVGALGGAGSGVYRLATRPALRSLRLPGILSRLRLVERLHLSPEGYGVEHHRRITRALLARGIQTITFALHSPSVQPGCTPYVQSEADLVQLLDACRRYFDFFLNEVGGRNATATELWSELAATPTTNH
jgi:hypothetical protein